MSNAFSGQGTLFGVKEGSSTVAAGDFEADDNTITRDADSWADVHEVGDILTTDSATNPGPFVVVSITGTNKILTVTGVVTDEAFDSPGVTFTRYAPVKESKNIDGPSSSASPIDVTSLDSTRTEVVSGLLDSGKVSVETNYLPGDDGLALMQSAIENRTKENFIIVWPNGSSTVDNSYATFQGIVTEMGISASVGAPVTAKLSVTITGAVTFA